MYAIILSTNTNPKVVSMKKTIYKKPLIIVLSVYAAIVIVFSILLGIYLHNYSVRSWSPTFYGSYTWTEDMQFDLDMFPSLVIDEDATELKIMQISDPQLKFGNITSMDRRTMDLLDRALKAEQPDIAVCTGDLTLSIFTYHAYKQFADFMEQRQQYWTVVYGNHDSQFDCSKYTIYNLLKNYKYCLFDPGPSNIKGESNFLINVYKGETAKSNGDVAYSLVMLDSNMYPDGEDLALTDWIYDWIGEDQVAWYRWAIEGLQSIDANIQTSAFFHIALKEFADMYYSNELQKGNSIPEQIDTSTLLPVKGFAGTVCESEKFEDETVDDGYTVGIFYQGKNTGLYATAVELGSTKGMFIGHDHINTIRGYYGTEGSEIYLSYGLCCGYHTYPYFERDNALLQLAGLSNTPLYNMELWLDENGQQYEKGVNNIIVDLTADNYGQLTTYLGYDSHYKA